MIGIVIIIILIISGFAIRTVIDDNTLQNLPRKRPVANNEVASSANPISASTNNTIHRQYPINNEQISIRINAHNRNTKTFFDIAGLHINDRKSYILLHCKLFTFLTLFRDTDNQYSDRAIGVKHNNVLIGYVPEVDIDDISPLLDFPHKAKISCYHYDGYRLDVTVGIELLDM